jgi:hypothetical protein
MTDLLDRYINAVGRHLPRAKRADVQAELRSLIQDSLDAKAGDAEPTEEQVVAVLKEFGPPREVASSYAPSRQYLIGPGLYPIFVTVFQIGVVVLLGAQVVEMAFRLADGGNPLTVVLNAMIGLVQRGFSMAGSMVIIFAIIERTDAQPEIEEKKEWDPRSLPRIAPRDEINRGELGGEIAASLFTLWVLNIFGNGFGMDAADSPIARLLLDPAVRPYVIVSTFLLLVDTILCVVLLVQGHWSAITIGITTASHALWVIVLMMLGSVNWSALIEREWGHGEFGIFVSVLYYIIALVIGADAIWRAYKYFTADVSDSLPLKGNGSAPARQAR